MARFIDTALVAPGRIGLVALLAFACGALSPIKLELVGDIYAPELALPLVALVARLSANGSRGTREPLFAAFLLAGIVTLLGYAVSDLVQGSRPDQYLRGWGRVGLVVLDFICLAVIFGQDRRNLWWFSLGAGLGAVAFLQLVAGAPLGLWKFGYADPVLQVSAALGVFVPMQITSAWIGLLGVYSMFTDFRSFAAICLAVAVFIWLRVGRRNRQAAGSGGMLKLVLAGGAVLLALSVMLSMTGDSGSRRSESDAGRQAAFETGVKAVSRSPVIGYGSWPENREIVQLYLNRAHELRGGKGAGSMPHGKRVAFNPHSQILHAWFEGGLLGTAFLLMMAVQLVRQGPWLLTRRPPDALTPLLLYLAIVTAWNLFMSPFTAPHRLGIALGAAALVMLRMEQRQVARQPAVATARTASPVPEPAGRLAGAAVLRRKLRYAPRRLLWLQPARTITPRRT